jgi:MutS domain V
VLDPRAEYAKRLTDYEFLAANKNRLHIQVGNCKLAVAAAGLILAYLSLAKHFLPPVWLLLPIAVYLLLAAIHEQILHARGRAETAAAYYRKGIARIEDRWPGTGQTGDRFRDPQHVYADDLDLFGRGSLFELLSTARLPMGENRLASWLLGPSPEPEILERQTLVAELRSKLDLHQDLALTGEELRARLDPESLVGWAESAPSMPGMASRIAAVALALCATAGVVFFTYTSEYLPLLIVLAIEAVFRRWLLRRAEGVINGVSCNAEGLLLFAQVLQRLAREPFTSPRLRQHAAGLKSGAVPASRALGKLARVVYWIDAQHSLLAHIAELPLLYTVHVAFAAEAWRRRYGPTMRTWVNIAAEMEALLSLASYSFEHPDDPFPEFPSSPSLPHDRPSVDTARSVFEDRASRFETAAFFNGEDLGHPLIPEAKCVRNSVRLDGVTRVLLVSGSNMSGKSTLLRTAGINTVLAMAGAPVRAKALWLTPLIIGTRIRSTDSLQEGRSTFYTEILHIRRVFDSNSHRANTPSPLLFLFDELLEGTNSHDRRIGAERLIRSLLQRGAIGIVTTHDLALTEISASVGHLLRNMHFEDQITNNEMHFDYKLRDGVVTKSNALELMRLIGLDT